MNWENYDDHLLYFRVPPLSLSLWLSVTPCLSLSLYLILFMSLRNTTHTFKLKT